MKINSHKELSVYRNSFELALTIHKLSQGLPPEEKYSLTDQIRRSSRSVAANIAESFSKRKYPKYFINKLLDSKGEAAETQVWLGFAHSFGYLNEKTILILDEKYEHIQAQILRMIQYPEKWSI